VRTIPLGAASFIIALSLSQETKGEANQSDLAVA